MKLNAIGCPKTLLDTDATTLNTSCFRIPYLSVNDRSKNLRKIHVSRLQPIADNKISFSLGTFVV